MRDTSEFASTLVLKRPKMNTFRDVLKKHSKILESIYYHVNTKGKKIGNKH